MDQKKSVQPTVLMIGIVMAVLVFLLPFGYGLDLGPGPDILRALVWEYMDAPWFTGYRIVNAGIFFDSLLYTFTRFIFLYFMVRYYLNKTTRKSLILAGIASELFPPLLSAIRIMGWLLGWTQPPPPLSDLQSPVYIPTLLLLICGLTLVFLLPPRARKINVSPDDKGTVMK